MKRILLMLLIISLSMAGCSQSKHSVTQNGITAKVTEFLEDRQYKVEVIGGDNNYIAGDIIIVNTDESKQNILETGNTIAITYSEFEKTNIGNIITPGQIEIITN